MPHLKYLNTYWNVASDEVWLPGICALCCRIVWLSFLTVLLVISSLALSLCQNGGILIAYLCLSLFTFLSSLLCEVLIIRTSITGSISEHEDRDKTLVFYLRFRYGIAFVEILLSIFGCFVIAYREQVRNNLPCVTTVDFSSYGPIGQILLSIVIASQFIESLVIIVGTIIQYNRPVDMQPDEIIKQYKSRRRGQLSPSSEINVEEERKRKFDAFAIRGQKYLKKTFKMVQLLSCNLFGGNQIFEEEYTTLGRLLSSLFHHGG